MIQDSLVDPLIAASKRTGNIKDSDSMFLQPAVNGLDRIVQSEAVHIEMEADATMANGQGLGQGGAACERAVGDNQRIVALRHIFFGAIPAAVRVQFRKAVLNSHSLRFRLLNGQGEPEMPVLLLDVREQGVDKQDNPDHF